MPEITARLSTALADRYKIEREIGSGGMATVYLAEDLKLKRKVAVKVLRPELAATLGPERFLREIEIAAGLTHPHILPLHDSGEADGFLYYVMPYVEGESLRERLDRDGKLSVEDVVRLTDDIAAALSYAHEHGIVHRDVHTIGMAMTRSNDGLSLSWVGEVAKASESPAGRAGRYRHWSREGEDQGNPTRPPRGAPETIVRPGDSPIAPVGSTRPGISPEAPSSHVLRGFEGALGCRPTGVRGDLLTPR